jgi:hypothetical protein
MGEVGEVFSIEGTGFLLGAGGWDGREDREGKGERAVGLA